MQGPAIALQPASDVFAVVDDAGMVCLAAISWGYMYDCTIQSGVGVFLLWAVLLRVVSGGAGVCRSVSVTCPLQQLVEWI